MLYAGKGHALSAHINVKSQKCPNDKLYHFKLSWCAQNCVFPTALPYYGEALTRCTTISVVVISASSYFCKNKLIIYISEYLDTFEI